MGVYILRRLLLMIPTLFGITFLVFMLIALSPGGIGAGLQAGSGQMDSSSRALKEAYLEDRYGLNDPAPVQYLRWLGRVSPIKFGVRDQVNNSGERVQPPKAVKEPPLWEWFTDDLHEPAEFPVHEWAEVDTDGLDENEAEEAEASAKAQYFRKKERAYSQARGRLITSRAKFNEQLEIAIDTLEIKGARTRKGKVDHEALEKNEVAEAENWDAIEKAGTQMIENYHEASEARAELESVFLAEPFPQAGFGIIPGAVTISSPDLGVSFIKQRPVSTLIKERLPVTLLLNLIATPIIYFIAVPCGLLAAVRSGGFFDKVSGAMFIALWSFPIPLAGVLAIGYLANNDYLGWFPVSGLHAADADSMTFLPTNGANGWEMGFVLDTIWHVCLPVMCLVYGGFAVLSKQARAAMLDNFNMDYVRTAKAKGVAGRDIVMRHVFRNSLLPLITMFVTIFPAMLAGSVVIEKIFTINGMGSLTLDAITLRDRELLLATTMMIAAVNLLAMLAADILYAMADPRISYK